MLNKSIRHMKKTHRNVFERIEEQIEEKIEEAIECTRRCWDEDQAEEFGSEEDDEMTLPYDSQEGNDDSISH